MRSSSRSTAAEAPLTDAAPRGREAAFFDLDKTLMAGSSGMQFARAAAKRGIVSRRQLAGWAWDHLRYRLRGASDEETADVLKVARELITGVPGKEIDRMGPEVLAAVLPRIYPEMLAEIHRHQDEGRSAFIVSAAGDGIVGSLAAVLGMEGGIGTRYELDAGGQFTGRLDGPFVYGPGKVEAMERYATEHGIDLGRSWAYSDSASDLPMLRAVGNPVVVNPDPGLIAIARNEGWQVMQFERLGRRLAVAGATVLAALVGLGGRSVAARRRPRPRRFGRA
ncbi:MAG TPA: HAD-IB family hydrolase [Solirubrobacterales bacterium]|nr:HAD-IB family hydrolase [Solirubrobacterales bacterium]